MKLVRYFSLAGLSILFGSNAVAAPGEGPSAQLLDLTLSARDTYDSNALRGTSVRQTRPDASKSDLIFTPSVNVNAVAPIGRHDVFLRGSVGYQFHRKNDYLDSTTIGLTGGTTLRVLGGCDTVISGDHQRRQSDLTDFIDVLDPRNKSRFTTAAINFNCETKAGIVSSLGYRRSVAENSSALRENGDYDLDGLDASVGFTRPAIGTVSVFGNYSAVNYSKRVQPGLAGATDGVKIYAGGLRFQRDIGARLKGSASIGYSFVDQRLPGVPSFNGANYGLDLSYDSRNRLKMSFGLSKNVSQSNQIGVSYSINRRINFDANYALGRSFRLAAGVFQQRRTSQPSALSPLTGLLNTRDKVFGTYARLVFQGNGPISLSADVGHDRRRSNIPAFDYNSTRFGVTATYRLSGLGL